MCVSRTKGFAAGVQNPYIRRMTKLQRWMNRNKKLDQDVARAVKKSRSQISRIRRGKTSARHDTARRLETLTGIRWWHFMQRG